jgi:K319L-like, PKD domain/FG-GAP repeat
MNRYFLLTCLLSLSLLLTPVSGVSQAPAAAAAVNVSEASTALPEAVSGIPNAGSDWWGATQENIRQSEYQVSWQEQTYLTDLLAAYQAPNRAHNLRTYFTPEGIRVIPRTFEGETPPWEWSLALSGYGTADDIQLVAAAILTTDDNHITYQRDDLTEWYVNDENGLEQSFIISRPPITDHRQPTAVRPSGIVLELAMESDLTPHLMGDGAAIEFTNDDGTTVLRYEPFTTTDAIGQTIHLQLELRSRLLIHLPISNIQYPITLTTRLTSPLVAPEGLSPTPSWISEGDQANALFGYSLGTAGDVNGDGYSDVIIGAPFYDNGEEDEGRAFVYHGGASGLAETAAWTAEVNQTNTWFGYSVGMAGDVNGDGYGDVVIGAPAFSSDQINEGRVFVYHGSASGLSPDIAWTAEGDQSIAQFGWSVGSAGDVNGDGYSDVIIGANWYDNDELNEGRAYVYHGSISGLAPNADWTAEGNQDGAEFGWSVGTAGDVNGDGYSDVIIGAPYYDNGEQDEGRAYVYHGSTSGLATTVAWAAEGDQIGTNFGTSVGTAGDVNGDGYSDVIIGAPIYNNDQTNEGRACIYHGSANGLTISPAWWAEGDQDGAYFGYWVGTAGDVNGDGYSDVIVGAYGYDNDQTDEGRAFVFQGSASGLATTPAWTAEGNQMGSGFGWPVGTAGDVNGDGYSDVIVGNNGYNNGVNYVGRAYVYHGSTSSLASSPAWTAESDQDYAGFGYSVGIAGDVNGDGYGDVIVGADLYDNGLGNEGRAYVYQGSSLGLSISPTWTVDGDQYYVSFGFSVGTAGDVNGDGYSDVIVGAIYYDNGEEDEGRAYVYHGSATGLSTSPAWIAEGNQPGAWFGYSVGTAGDVNGDGYSDVIVGAPNYDDGQPYEGQAYVYHGSASGLSTTADWTAESGQVGATFGYSVGTAGDVNGDGYSDVIIGAQQFTNGEAYEGRAYVYHGSTSGLLITAAWTAESDQVSANFGNSVGTVGDMNGDGYSDVIVGALAYDNGEENEGRTFVYHGSASGLAPTAAWTAESNQAYAYLGVSVGTAGDVNGDGYSDAIVGTGEGRAYVYHGAATGLSTDPIWTAESDQAGDNFGWSAGTAGDVNGDGYSDVIVGAYNYSNDQMNEGRVFVYYGNDSDGLHMITRQLRSDGSVPIAQLGMSDSRNTFQLSLIGRMPLGRGDVSMQWQVAPLGVPITSTDVISGTSDWTDVMTAGVVITQNITGLTLGTPYHWRVRLLYEPGNALGQPSGRWVTIPWNGWNETDLRTRVNQPPVANAGPDQNVNTLALVTLDGSGSSDPDDDLPLTYLWTQTGGPGVVLSDPMVVSPTFTTPGDPAVLTFTVSVTDSLGMPDSTPDEVVITVTNQPPVANAGLDHIVDTLALVMLDGSASSDPDGDLPLTYLWAQTGGPMVDLSDPTVVSPTFTAPGDSAVLTFTLSVTDSLGLPASTLDEVVVTVTNQPPIANAGSDQSVNTLALVTLDGSGSSDPDSDLPLTYLWMQTGGPTVVLSDPTAINPTFIAPSDTAVLTFTLTVTDSLGLPAIVPDEVVIIVQQYRIYLPLVLRQ